MENKAGIRSSGDVTGANEESSSENPLNDVLTPKEKPYSKHKEKENKYELSSEFRKKLEEFPEIIQFIKMLQKCIEKQRKKLKRSKKEKTKIKSISTQTEFDTVKDDSTKQGNDQVKSVTEEITEAAQQALQTNGFVYEETSGLYYDYNSGYYYNAEYGLYYDGNTGTYLKYNQDTKEYEFHSQTEVQVEVAKNENNLDAAQNDSKRTKKKSKKRQKSKRDELLHDDEDDSHDRKKLKVDAKLQQQQQQQLELEDGECSDLSETTSSCSDENESDIDISKQYPPCMRIIIEDTSIPSLKPGSLHLITFEGGSIGREGAHVLLLPEINTSKHHAKVTFDTEKNSYFLTDLGSRNGTLLNGKRIAPAKVESDPVEIPHGSRVQIGSTTLLLHVHNGSQTCGHCEPGLLKNLLVKEPVSVEEEGKSTKSLDHKQQLRQLRKKFGLSQNDTGKIVPGAGYKDRAMHRRVTVGSQNPHEKTQTASLNESIAPNNKGFKLLSKMGWKEGQALGKDNQGRLEPVELVSNPGTSGMGSANETKVIQPSTEYQPPPQIKTAKQNAWTKAQERYKQAESQEPADIFDLTDV